jgi:hypothetical protein
MKTDNWQNYSKEKLCVRSWNRKTRVTKNIYRIYRTLRFTVGTPVSSIQNEESQRFKTEWYYV